ncbi:hypothetical protein HF086_006778 [Spodoptera exigua]|uniref:Uncharacterized protein n=1 Tax=Spodoptera exigua TaxID=7107 RepID=A0A922MAP5_SPOEX|nr:hypothetical protein HF086_006778 [Spodoptera exigua]
MDKNNVNVVENNPTVDKKKNLGCWARFKSLFEDRGFDLEYEYGQQNLRSISILGESHDSEGYRRITERKRPSVAVKDTTYVNSSNNVTGEVVNFYEQFTIVSDEKEDPDLWAKSVRRRVSMRPSAILTNIAEEPDDEIEVVRRNNIII